MSFPTLTEELDDAAEQDSVFISAADLFSLLSLAVIYVVVMSNPSAVPLRSELVVQAAIQQSGQGQPIDPDVLYFWMARTGATVTFYAELNERRNHWPVQPGVNGVAIPKAWIDEMIQRDPTLHRIFLVISPHQSDAVIRSAFVDMLAFLQNGKYPSVQVAVL